MKILALKYIPKTIVYCLVIVCVISCTSSKVLSSSTANKKMTVKTVIKQHYLNSLKFKTLNGKMKVEYSNGDSSNAVSVSLRIKKDSAIWISAPFGAVKAYITPNRVSFYNKLERTYFDGDFSFLSKLLGTSLDFDKVQNLLLGQAIFDLRDSKYMLEIADENYQLKPKKIETLFKTLFRIEPRNFKISMQQLAQPLKKRVLTIAYKNYQKVNKWVLPNDILITAIEKDKKNTITIAYRNMEFDADLNFPYKLPKGYEEIVLDKDDI